MKRKGPAQWLSQWESLIKVGDRSTGKSCRIRAPGSKSTPHQSNLAEEQIEVTAAECNQERSLPTREGANLCAGALRQQEELQQVEVY